MPGRNEGCSCIDRAAELSAIEAHIAERGVTRCPTVGSAELIEASLYRLREKRRWNQHPLGRRGRRVRNAIGVQDFDEFLSS